MKKLMKKLIWQLRSFVYAIKQLKDIDFAWDISKTAVEHDYDEYFDDPIAAADNEFSRWSE